MKRNRISVVALLIVMTCFLSGCKKTVDLAEYVDVSYSGLNGFATAYVELGEAWLAQEIADRKVDDVTELSLYMQMADGVRCTLNKDSALSNGDKLEVIINFSEDFAQTVSNKLNINLAAKSRTFTVEGLEEGKAVNPFSDLTVQFDGVGMVEVKIQNHSEDPFCKGLTYRYEITQRATAGTIYPEKGDIITVRPDMTQQQAMAQGYILMETEKTYPVENLCAYVTSAEQIDLAKCVDLEEELRTELRANLDQKDSFDNLVGNALSGHPNRNNDALFWSSEKQVHGELTPVTAYFYCPAAASADKKKIGEYGKIGYVYKTTVDTDEFSGQTVYLCAEAKPLYIREDGTLSWGTQKPMCMALGYDEAGYREAMKIRCGGSLFSNGYTLDLIPLNGGAAIRVEE